MTNENRKTGNAFEQRLCRVLSERGYWAHNLAQNSAGQPFDVIAAKDGRSFPIDCKVCANNLFKLSRIEENQASAMTLWRETGNGDGWFALELIDKTIIMISFATLETLSATRTVLGLNDILTYGLSLEAWVIGV